jgi:hypothetical protein
MKCSYCGKEAILISGYSYCIDHIGQYDKGFFERAVCQIFNNAEMIDKFLLWAFGTINPKLSDLSKWHNQIYRGKWDNKNSSWNITQDDYIREIAKKYRKEIQCG